VQPYPAEARAARLFCVGPAGDMEGGTPSHYSGMPAFLKPANIPSL